MYIFLILSVLVSRNYSAVINQQNPGRIPREAFPATHFLLSHCYLLWISFCVSQYWRHCFWRRNIMASLVVGNVWISIALKMLMLMSVSSTGVLWIVCTVFCTLSKWLWSWTCRITFPYSWVSCCVCNT